MYEFQSTNHQIWSIKTNALAQKQILTVCIDLFWVATTTKEIVFNQQTILELGELAFPVQSNVSLQ